MESKGSGDNGKRPAAPPPVKPIWGAWDEASARTRSEQGARLAELVRDRIVPRLVMLHRDLSPPRSREGVCAEDIIAFGRLIIGSDPDLVTEFAERMRERGLSSDDLFETLLAPTARHLGEIWERDLCDFVEVGLGVGRLQTLLDELSHAQMVATDLRRRALLISTESNQHVFGLDIVASFLRSSGWDTIVEKGLGVDANARSVAADWFSVAGVTMSRESSLDSVARVIAKLRRASMNPELSIMVGGVAFAGRPELVARVGADAAANDGPGAALLAQRLHLRQTATASAKREADRRGAPHFRY